MSKALSVFLRDELARRRFSQRDGSVFAEVGPTTVHYLMRHSQTDPRPTTLNKIADGWKLPRRMHHELAGFLEPDGAMSPQEEGLVDMFCLLSDPGRASGVAFGMFQWSSVIEVSRSRE